MKKIVFPLLLAAIVALSGCATTGGLPGFGGTKAPETAEQSAARKDNNRQAAKTGFLTGCIGGAAGGWTGGLKGMLKGCAVGGAIVGTGAWVVENQKQLKSANELAAQTRAAGGKATVKEKTTQVKNSKTGQMEDVQTLERLTIEFPPKALASRSDGVKALIKKAATMAAASKVPVEITAYGATQADSQWIALEVGEQVLSLPKTQGGGVSVKNKVGAPARLELSPVPSL